MYFAESPETAFAEVLQGFHASRVALQADADAVEMTVEEYKAAIYREAAANGVSRPWAVDVDWQMSRCIHRVQMPSDGWWVRIDRPETMNRLSPVGGARTNEHRLPHYAGMESWQQWVIGIALTIAAGGQRVGYPALRKPS